MWFVLEGREGGKDIYLFLRALSSPRIGYPSRCARLPAFSEVLCGVYGYRTNVFDLVMGHSLDMGHLAITVSHILK